MPILERSGSQIFFADEGAGQPLLLLQGVGVIGEGWRPQVDDLRDRYHTCVIDNRGIGQSHSPGPITIEMMAHDALAVMDKLGWASAHLVGHSMGGVIAQQIALLQPHRVRSLALLCTFSRGPEAARLTWPVLVMTIRTRLGSKTSRRRAFLEILMPPERLREQDVDALADRMAQLIGRDLASSPPIMMRQLQAMRKNDLSHRLAELADLPTLVVSARQDPIALVQYGQRLHQAIPGSRFVVLEDASHGVTLEQPDLVNRLLREFLDQVALRHPGEGEAR